MKTKMMINLVLVISVILGYAAKGVNSLKYSADSVEASHHREGLAVIEPGNRSFQSGSRFLQDGWNIFSFGNVAYESIKKTAEGIGEYFFPSHVVGALEGRQEVNETDHLQMQEEQDVSVKSFRVEADPEKVDEDEEVKNWRKLGIITMPDERIGTEPPVKSFWFEADPEKLDEEEVQNLRKLASINTADERTMTETPNTDVMKTATIRYDVTHYGFKFNPHIISGLRAPGLRKYAGNLKTDEPVASSTFEADPKKVDEEDLQNLKKVTTTTTPYERAVTELPNTDVLETATIRYDFTHYGFKFNPLDISGLRAPGLRKDGGNLKTDKPVASSTFEADPEKVDEEEVQNLRKLASTNTPDERTVTESPNTDATETSTIHYDVTDNEFISRPHDTSGLRAPTRREDPGNLEIDLPPGRVLQYFLFVSKKIYDLWWTE